MHISLSMLRSERGFAAVDLLCARETLKRHAMALDSEGTLRLCSFCLRKNRDCVEARRSRPRCWKAYRRTQYRAR
ncbi:MAG: hypothetical protein JNK05_28650 [Myxococcales bacterium]|nr:hypothetical protein [Myxococcales bacterium]